MNEYSDVAAWSEMNNLGHYNSVLKMMEVDGMIPGYETKTFSLYQGVGSDYGYSPELTHILNAFVQANGEQEILL